MKVSVVRNRFREDKIFKGKLDRVNALIKMWPRYQDVTPIPLIVNPGKAVQESRFSLRPAIPGKLKSYLKSDLHLFSQY